MIFTINTAEYKPRHFIPELTAGLVIGLLMVVYSISYAGLIFAGPLEGLMSRGAGIAVFSALVLGLVTTLFSQVPTAINIPQDKSAAILGLAASALAGAGAGVAAEGLFAWIALATMLSGAGFYLMGRFRLTGFIRFIPYPVVGGFIAGTGWLIVAGGMRALTGLPLDLADLGPLAGEKLVRWLPSLLFALALMAAARRIRHNLLMPVALLLAFGLFYGTLAWAGLSVEEARGQQWLLGPFPTGGLWSWPDLRALCVFPLDTALSQFGPWLTLTLVSAISILFNVTALELMSGSQTDLNREMRVAAASNVLAGLGGGLVGYPSLSLSSMNHKLGSRGRFPGLVAMAVCAAILWGGAGVLDYFPRPVMGALLLFMGLEFLYEWVVGGWSKLTRTDYAMVVGILLCITWLGFLGGVVAGVVACSLIFVVQYSATGVIRYSMDARLRPSDVERSPAEQESLEALDLATVVYRLQGHLFFGSAHRVHQSILADTRGRSLAQVVLDFSLVTGMDSSASISFARLRDALAGLGVKMLATGLTPAVHAAFQEGTLEGTRIFGDIGQALSWCEEQGLEAAGRPRVDGLASLMEHLFPGDSAKARDFETYLQSRVLAPGERLFAEGDRPDGLFFVERGQVEILVGRGSQQRRIKTVGPGTVVGEMGLVTDEPRSATAVAPETARVRHLSSEAMTRLVHEKPEVAQLLSAFVIRSMAARLKAANRTVDILMQ